MKYPRRTSITQFDNDTIAQMYKRLMATEGGSREQIRASYNTTPNVINAVLAWGIERAKIEFREHQQMQQDIEIYRLNDTSATIGNAVIVGHRIEDGKLIPEVNKII